MIPFDLLLSIGSTILTLEMFPMIVNRKTAVPFWGSIGTAIVLTPYFSILFWLLGTPIMSAVITLEGIFWWYLVLFRRVKRQKETSFE